MSAHYFRIYVHHIHSLFITCSCFSIHLFFSSPFFNWPSNDNRFCYCCKIEADKWRENFSTESEMLSHLFTHSCLTHWEKTDFLQPLKSALMRLSSISLYWLLCKVNVSLTQNDIIVIYWNCELWHWMTLSHIKR